MTAAISGPRPILGGECFRRADARAHGLSDRRVSDLVREGSLRQVLRGVYVDASSPDSIEVRASALGLVCPPGAAVARRTAAWLYGVDARAPAERAGPMDVECIVPPDVTPMRVPGVRCFQAPLRNDVNLVSGLACTNPLRTALDGLRFLQPHMGLGLADALAHAGWITPDPLQAEVERWAGARNIDRARRLASFVEPAAESMGESWARLRVLDAGFPRPAVQVPVLRNGIPVYRLDLGFPEHALGLEYDGREFHSSWQQREHDRRRRADIERELGWRVLAVTLAEVLGRSMAFEWGLGELLGMQPTIRWRSW